MNIIDMKNMKKIIIAFFLFIPVVVKSSSGVVFNNPLGESGGLPENIIASVIQYALGLSGILALIAFIYGGIWWLVSLGDSNKVTKGKEIMKWAVLGLFVIFSSYAIINVLFDFFGIK